jgi:hypothetical protein
MCDKEIVVCAAIWVQDDKKRPYQPTNIPSGTVFCGLRHPSILSQLAAYGIAHKNRSVQGFLTSKNRFLTRARRGKDISSFERQEKESGFNFLHNPNNGRMQSGHVKIDEIGLFKQIIE